LHHDDLDARAKHDAMSPVRARFYEMVRYGPVQLKRQTGSVISY
jgi:hypothetical protein